MKESCEPQTESYEKNRIHMISQYRAILRLRLLYLGILFATISCTLLKVQ